MAYKLLGIVVWKGAKWFLRRKYGAAMAPKPLMLAGGLLVVIAGIVLASRQRGGDG